MQFADKPGYVVDYHSSRFIVANKLMQPTRSLSCGTQLPT